MAKQASPQKQASAPQPTVPSIAPKLSAVPVAALPSLAVSGGGAGGGVPGGGTLSPSSSANLLITESVTQDNNLLVSLAAANDVRCALYPT